MPRWEFWIEFFRHFSAAATTDLISRATHVAHQTPMLTVMPLLDPADLETTFGSRLSAPLFYIGLGRSVFDLCPTWCSAANSFSKQPKFAIGSSGQVLELSADEGGFNLTSGMVDSGDLMFAVDWLDHNTIISGGRRGKVCLWDRRSRGQSMRFRHPAQINHVRKLEGSLVAVAGTNESVSLHYLPIQRANILTPTTTSGF